MWRWFFEWGRDWLNSQWEDDLKMIRLAEVTMGRWFENDNETGLTHNGMMTTLAEVTMGRWFGNDDETGWSHNEKMIWEWWQDWLKSQWEDDFGMIMRLAEDTMENKYLLCSNEFSAMMWKIHWLYRKWHIMYNCNWIMYLKIYNFFLHFKIAYNYNIRSLSLIDACAVLAVSKLCICC